MNANYSQYSYTGTYTDYYTNCCNIPHWICSIVICIIFFVVSVALFTIAFFWPEYLDKVYQVGGYPEKIIVCGTISASILIVANSALAFGIAKNWALFLLIWMIISLILWKLHIILFLCAFVFLCMKKRPTELFDYVSVIGIFFVQVFWMISFSFIAIHWYAICEELYMLEYGTQPRRLSRKLYTLSNRRSLSHYSQRERMPQVLHRLDRR